VPFTPIFGGHGPPYNRKQKTENRKQKTENGKPKTKNINY